MRFWNSDTSFFFFLGGGRGGCGGKIFVTWQQKNKSSATHTKDFSEKKNPKEQISEITVFRKWVTAGRQNIARFFNSLYFDF
jgi:hypothetical protein